MPATLAVVILYFPDDGLFESIRSYIHHVDHLLLIDNSGTSEQWLRGNLEPFDGEVTFVRNPENLGVAMPLNYAARYGLDHGFSWLLTMDQDSSFAPGALEAMKDFAKTSEPAVALIAPFHQTPKANPPAMTSPTRNLRMTMTSGNLLRLESYKTCGPFDEKLFIDSVDHEYCLRLRRLGFRIIRVNKAILHHQLGRIVYRRFLFVRLKTTNHPATRRYYITRNRLYVMFKYLRSDGWFFRREFLETAKAFAAVVILENDKLEKLKAMIRGAWHFVKGRYGKI